MLVSNLLAIVQQKHPVFIATDVHVKLTIKILLSYSLDTRLEHCQFQSQISL